MVIRSVMNEGLRRCKFTVRAAHKPQAATLHASPL